MNLGVCGFCSLALRTIRGEFGLLEAQIGTATYSTGINLRTAFFTSILGVVMIGVALAHVLGDRLNGHPPNPGSERLFSDLTACWAF
jgi:hypothetical protein